MSQTLVNPGHSFGVVLVTIDTEANAIALAQRLVEAGLAACASFSPIRSVYRWQGDIQTDSEWQLVIKTDLSRFEALTQTIMQHHPYEVPEIIALPIIAGSTDYLTWLAQQTQMN